MPAVIRTTHIQEMLRESVALAQVVNGQLGGERLDALHGRTASEGLARAETLALHAAAELRDEADRQQGWP